MSAIDDIKLLKELLDAGIVTQEEFDAKKKQLLDLPLTSNSQTSATQSTIATTDANSNTSVSQNANTAATVHCPSAPAPQNTEAATVSETPAFQQPGLQQVPMMTVPNSAAPNQNKDMKRPAKSKVAAGVLAILFGAFGAHKFYLGYIAQGFILLAITLFTFGLGAIVTGIIGIVEGIIYLTKSDDDFDVIYVQNKKGWF